MAETYQLNGRNVFEGMYRRAETAIRNGRGVLLTTFEGSLDVPEPAKPYVCPNCDGVGKLALEFLGSGNGKGETWHKGHWHSHELVLFLCPDCSGGGKSK